MRKQANTARKAEFLWKGGAILEIGYLLPVKGLEEDTRYREAIARIDRTRREKVLSCLGKKDCLRSLGAGLLLQWGAGQGAAEVCKKEAGILWRQLSLEEIIRAAGPVKELRYIYGPAGKPYLADSLLFFSLSHSGDYVACVFSHREVGLDLQQVRKIDAEKLSRRFFSGTERALLGELETEQERTDFFFRLWSRKEAYGKLTGRGAAGVLGTDVSGKRSGVEWEEYDGLPDYHISVCTYAGNR